eukprot:CAMPEP_0115164722 /NCGR_PEP_ID=MMETSP0227-20121206/73190_1 /TAXON_ID=89957 /ORGANISM="Polarella glacialis, Strain CCMP 1383" /LENGTH=282 /DNA_ID=CAMNT_0002577105 /DNA_START=56 /DNA_END=904 /DNA_ORIENTATION=-
MATPASMCGLRPLLLSFGASRRTFGRVASERLSSPITLSPHMTARATRGVLENIDLLVCDMAGTVVQEGGFGLQDTPAVHAGDDEMHPWHGAKKEAVIEHFARKAKIPDGELEQKIQVIGDAFVNSIDEAYFAEASPIGHIDIGLMGYFKQLKEAGVKLAFNTGYPRSIQEGLIKRLNFDQVVDAFILDVKEGRPYPYMIHRLMEELHIENVRRVAKVGDSVRDIEEGRNAGCGLVVGVLSGADSASELFAAGADMVANCVTDLPIPRKPVRLAKLRLPDLS